ncbi:MAG: helicase C-terminal domain-containing protein [Sedimentisphaerales bacterium]|jgi:ATP-dependent DNA helicase DinG
MTNDEIQSIALNIDDFFAPGGVVGKSFDGYERRQQQVEMAKAVQKALSTKRHLVAEAGTGVGKSLAYLVPAIEKAILGANRVVISTFTIALQEQLINKDIPCLNRCLPWGFKATLAKGKSNYVCKRRLEFAIRRQMGLFDQFGDALAEMNNWATKTADGSLSDLPFIPDGRVWDAVKAEHGNCKGRKCGHFTSCFCQRAKRELENANVIVTNHALLFSDLALREEEFSILPDYKWVIIDEAHNIERVAEEHFGIEISSGSVRFLLDGLYNPRTHKGLLVYTESGKLTDLVVKASEAAKEFFKSVQQWDERHKTQTNGRCYKNFIEDKLSAQIKELRAGLTGLAKQAKDEDERFELTRYVDKCAGLLQDLEAFLPQTKQDYVYWVETSENKSLDSTRSRRETVSLKSAPLNVGADVKRSLFDKFDSVVMTSATLSSGEDGRRKTGDPASPKGYAVASRGGFEFFAGRVGLRDYDAVKLGSPFDYQKQVTIYIESDLPEPNDEKFAASACEAVKKYVLRTQGRAFVLFTSYKMLGNFAEQLAEWFKENNIELLQQGVGLDRTSLLKRFKMNGRFVLFGTDSFWQGVDVAGEALSNVIIVRLPFAVPDTPLLAGRLDKIKEEGGNPFAEYQLPLAIIKFKQGFGRLIRTKTDTGIVVILDSRILSKSYGKNFLVAIPKCRMEIAASSM